MKLLVCIDDTDNLESIGSGELLEIMGKELEKMGLGEPSYITRHQLFVHADIPYTSHNSSMCFELTMKEENYGKIKDFIVSFISGNSAEGSDPGVCLIKKEELEKEEIHNLVEYGKLAKDTILKKEDAYNLASSMKGKIHLSEHGGTGGGVIGALAGCGLRLSGSDGRLKGKIYPENAGNKISVSEIVRRYPFEEVRNIKNNQVLKEEKIQIGEELKGVFLDKKIVLMVKPFEDIYISCNKKELKAY